MGILKNLGFYFILFIVLSACGSDKYEKTYAVIDQNETSKYVGAKACISCHNEEVVKWQGSHHDLAMQIANDTTVLGDFNDVATEIDGVSYFFFRKNKEFFVRITEIDDSVTEYKISYTFGLVPLQQYLIDFDRGRKQVLRVTWDTEKKKWFHQYKGDTIEPSDWLHWSRGAQNWNTMCAECHSTNLEKKYSIENDAFNTTYSEINVSCESCHGPAYEHVEWANSDPTGENTYILKGIDQKEQLQLCAPCHARRVKLTENLEPGIPFGDQYRLQSLSPNFYHGDGQIQEEDYVYGSFRQSKMYTLGVKCTDCHDSHSLKLKFEGNQLCTQCHLPEQYNSEKHHFHAQNTEASLCINCHMTGEVYMGNDFRRDHSFRIPRPDQTMEYGTPNACTQCHKDKSDQWAANSIKKWYGTERANHFSDALLVSSSTDIRPAERAMLDQFMTDLEYPDIARATVIENLSFTNQDQYNVLLKALNDSSPLVRYHALMKFRALPPENRTSIALKFVQDPTKMVRIGAAQLVIGIDGNTLGATDQLNVSSARKELETMLFSNADFSTGRMQLGDYYLQKNEILSAIKHYEMALQKDSLLTPVYSNLSVAYSLNNNFEAAGATLDHWIGLEPELSRPHYLKALLNFEMQKMDEAVSEFKEAIRLNPNDTRSMYNLATFYYQNNKDLSLAEKYINQGLNIEPGNQDYNYLLALIYKEQGRIKEGQAILDALRASPRQ